jgi:hypothetical protein
MLEQYFATAGDITSASAWQHIYRLLLWIDRSTGLAHCYESDKVQPGRPWYGRSLAFHGWVARELGTTPAELGGQVDWLFKKGTELYAVAAEKQRTARIALAAEQRAAHAGEGYPEPGEDPELAALIREGLTQWLHAAPPNDALRSLTDQIRSYLGQENRRKNLVGEGFEDVLTFLIARVPGADALEVRTRPLLEDLPGFHPPPGAEKPRRVDLAVVRPDGRRELLTVKWSIRADREEQFGVDFEAYARLEAVGEDFGFVLVTNEFDAARLSAACERRRQNANLFSAVVDVNPAGPMAAYGSERRGAAGRLADHIDTGRLLSLEKWLASLTQ